MGELPDKLRLGGWAILGELLDKLVGCVGYFQVSYQISWLGGCAILVELPDKLVVWVGYFG